MNPRLIRAIKLVRRLMVEAGEGVYSALAQAAETYSLTDAEIVMVGRRCLS